MSNDDYVDILQEFQQLTRRNSQTHNISQKTHNKELHTYKTNYETDSNSDTDSDFKINNKKIAENLFNMLENIDLKLDSLHNKVDDLTNEVQEMQSCIAQINHKTDWNKQTSNWTKKTQKYINGKLNISNIQQILHNINGMSNSLIEQLSGYTNNIQILNQKNNIDDEINEK